MHKIFFGKGSKPVPMGEEWPFNRCTKIGEERHKKNKNKRNSQKTNWEIQKLHFQGFILTKSKLEFVKKKNLYLNMAT